MLVLGLLGFASGAGVIGSSAGTAPPPTEVALSRAPAGEPIRPSIVTQPTTTTTIARPAPVTTAPPPTTAPPSAAAPSRVDGPTLLAWMSGGLPDGFAADVVALPQVRAATVVAGDLLRLTETIDAGGSVVDRAVDGWAIPIDAFAVDPASYAGFQAGPDRDILAALQPGGAVLTRASADLRRLGVGGTLRFVGGDVRVQGIVDDHNGGGAEVIVHRADAPRLGIDDERFILLSDTDRPTVERSIRQLTPPGEHLSLRSSTVAAWLRHGDRVQPQVIVKRTFGEFTFRDRAGRDIEIDPAWVRRHIVTESVPILGPITCHRSVVPLVRAAMTELERARRRDTVDPANYAGCQYARRMGPGAGLSRHSWGIALDLNVSSDPRGTYASQDPALVAAMTSRGFDWGGEWEFPDPGHYEFRAPG